jgi:uncharacterized protein (TIGR02147 family)
MDIFSYSDYKVLVNDLLLTKPNQGRGQYKRISEHLNVSSVLVSQIFKGRKDISIEQGHKLCDYFNFIELEKKFFVTLISSNRAGTFELRKFYDKELSELRKQAKSIVNRVKHKNVLSEEDKATFYSDWKYSGMRLACDLAQIVNISDLSSLFKVDEESIKSILEFLMTKGLVKSNNGNLEIGPSSTHISKSSPMVKNHHRNWRLKALESLDNLDDNEIMYTAPMTTSKEVYQNLNKKILKLIDEFVDEASSADGEDLYYLNIDLRKMIK